MPEDRSRPSRRRGPGGAAALRGAGQRAVIVTHLGVAVEIERPDGQRERVRVPRKSGLVVGDEVLVHGERLALEPRRTQLLRRSPGGGVHVVAANLDVLCVVAAVDPPARAGLVDRAAVAARAAGVEPALVVNKVDLPDPYGVVAAMRERARDDMAFFVVSAATGDGVEGLAAFIAAKGRAALVGPSGVGKSALLNRLVPDAGVATRALSDATGAGRHTTTASTLRRLARGGELVDTPGVREYGLVDVAPAELAAFFPGFASVEEGCRFRDCLHEEEPGCAVKRALEEGRVRPDRYLAYRNLLAETKGG
jgi:ribosome biogenesis GTPase / thiamine phosphate phosphatase